MEGEPVAEAMRAAEVAQLSEELQALILRDDPAGMLRQYEVHRALIRHVWQSGTQRGQSHAEQAVLIARKLHDQRREAEALHDWGHAYFYEHMDVDGDHDHPTREECQQAQQLHEQALQIREQILGPDHPDVADSLLQIVSPGRVYYPFEPYVSLAQRALEIYERALGPEHERTHAVLEQLATLLRSTKEYKQVLAIYERLRLSYEHMYGPDDYHTHNTVRNIIWTLRQNGDNVPARELAEQIYALHVHQFGLVHQQTLEDLYTLLDIFEIAGETDTANELTARTLAVLEQTASAEHPHMASFLGHLGAIALSHNKLDVAQQHYQRALTIYEDAFGPDNMMTISYLHTLFTLYWIQGDEKSALAAFDRLVVSHPIVGPAARGPAPLLQLLTSLCWKHSNSALLRVCYVRLLAYAEEARGATHSDTAAILHDWGVLLHNDDDIIPARIALERALEIRERVLPPDHPDRLATLGVLNSLLCDKGEYGLVRTMYERALVACIEKLGPEHPQTAAMRLRLSILPKTADNG